MSRPAVSRRDPAVVVLLTAAAASVMMTASLLLPWLRTGRVERSAINVVRVARLLGVTERESVSAAVVAVVIAPIVGSLAVLALAWRAYRAGAIALLAQSLTAIAAGGVVLGVGGARGVGVWSGPWWSVGAGSVGLGAALTVLWTARRVVDRPSGTDLPLPHAGSRAEDCSRA